MRTDGLRTAQLIALFLPLALIAGALGSQFFGGLVPCEMCHWQRWPHYAAIIVAAVSFAVPHRPTRMLFILFAAVLIALSGGIGAFHAGVEYHWWLGITPCSTDVAQGDPMKILMEQIGKPLIRCDAAQWQLFGISLAGFNAILSIVGAVAIFALAVRRSR
ncbi:MAG: disulfide bond formation protein B [Sphingomonadales bacterium]|nr:MAG: disulfide bond formation protein B [Sphingomonadales bacterium]